MSMVYTEFTLCIIPNGADVSKAEAYLEEFLEEFEVERKRGDRNGAIEFIVQECTDLPYPDDAESFAVRLAKLIPEASFCMECCNIDERSGGPFEFNITYSDGKITSEAHVFDYEPMAGEEFSYNYPDYDYFCEEMIDEETGECPYSEEQYAEFCSAELLFVSGCSVLTDAPKARTFSVE